MIYKPQDLCYYELRLLNFYSLRGYNAPQEFPKKEFCIVLDNYLTIKGLTIAPNSDIKIVSYLLKRTLF